MIKITDDIFIDADECQYILQKRRKDGIRLDTLGYYSKLSSAVEGCITHQMREKVQTTDMTLAEAVAAFSTLEQSIKELLPEQM